MPRRPAIYRAARGLRILATVLLLLLVVFLAAVADSAAQIRPTPPTDPGFTAGADNTVLIDSNLTIDNPGAFAIDRLTIHAEVMAPGSAGRLLASGGSPLVHVGAGSQLVVPLVLVLPLVENTDLPLLTQDMVLPSVAWVNATYATIFEVRLVIPHNYSWGAPFANLSIQVGRPVGGPNGTTTFPVNVSFTNDASFGDDGTLGFRINTPDGAECARVVQPIAVGAHSPAQLSQRLTVPDVCATPSSQFVLSYSSGPWQVAFPAAGLP